MTSNFQIRSFKTRNSLHLKLYGNFDTNSAQELISNLLTHGARYWDTFIDTNNLKTVHPFGKIALQMNLRNFKKQLNNLFFVGKNKHKIA